MEHEFELKEENKAKFGTSPLCNATCEILFSLSKLTSFDQPIRIYYDLTSVPNYLFVSFLAGYGARRGHRSTVDVQKLPKYGVLTISIRHNLSSIECILFF